MRKIAEELLDAVHCRDETRAGELLLIGADPNSRDPEFFLHTPLHSAAQSGLIDTARRLLQAGANPNAKNDRGHTPLHYASAEPNPEIVKLLLDHAADPRARDDRGFTPLHCAAGHWTTEIVRILLAAGA